MYVRIMVLGDLRAAVTAVGAALDNAAEAGEVDLATSSELVDVLG